MALVFWNTSPLNHTLGDISTCPSLPFPAYPAPPGWSPHALPVRGQAWRAWSHEKEHQDPMKSQCLEPPGSRTFLPARCLPKSEWTDSEEDYIVTRKIKVPLPLKSKCTGSTDPLSLLLFINSDSNVCVSEAHPTSAGWQSPALSATPLLREFRGGNPKVKAHVSATKHFWPWRRVTLRRNFRTS